MRKETWHFRKPDPVVLALCALVLISCLGAVGRQGRMRAKEMVCLGNLHQWGHVFESYTQDNQGNFLSGAGAGSGLWWLEPLWPYHQSPRLSLCPTATTLPGQGKARSYARQAWKSMRHVGSYGINGWICNPSPYLPPNGSMWGRAPVSNCWRTPAHEAADKAPVFSDMWWVDAWPRATDEPTTIDLAIPDRPNVDEMERICMDRHNGAVNLLFMDWSARKVGLKGLWTLKWHRSFDTTGPWTKAGGVEAADWPEWMRDFKDYQ